MANKNSKWNPSTKKLVKELHSNLTIDNINWHKFKNDSDRRSAELLISAISQIVNDGEVDDIQSLINQALLWAKKEIKDPGCPKV
ncbi:MULTISPECIES: DUF6439 family protein [Prochlorococcus]|uniref:DUF6439 family protein n=1 Tax=Prochlorococcus TaxID=1218 RepID=UPI000533AB3C|nr:MULTISPECIES: DUF6439 family protein [Prochlorococcus]KGG12614.1 hypothetical protein EV05_1826 [Prochlorococcus sp. MIT 0601]